MKHRCISFFEIIILLFIIEIIILFLPNYFKVEHFGYKGKRPEQEASNVKYTPDTLFTRLPIYMKSMVYECRKSCQTQEMCQRVQVHLRSCLCWFWPKNGIFATLFLFKYLFITRPLLHLRKEQTEKWGFGFPRRKIIFVTLCRVNIEVLRSNFKFLIFKLKTDNIYIKYLVKQFPCTTKEVLHLSGKEVDVCYG